MEEADIENIKAEQLAVTCFFIHQGKMVKQTLDELQKAYTADEILPQKTTYQWHTVFQNGRKSLALQPKKEWLASQIIEVNVNTISVMIWEDRHLSVKSLEELKNISKLTIHHILMKNLRMQRVLSI